jgi:CheY-like chemotaxis protein
MGSSTSDEQRGRILIVDRDPHVRELERAFLGEAGFRVEFAEDGLAALERIRRDRPDLLITEVLLPRLDGLALCRQVKNDPELRGLPVLVLSVLAVTERAREAGADGCLRKPLTRHVLVQTVRTLLNRSGTLPTREDA